MTLVSASPRRSELLRDLQIPFDVLPSQCGELWCADSPEHLAILNAERKVRASTASGESARVLIGADTIIAIDGDVFGKPAGRDSAHRMLRRLSGCWHRVITGVFIAQNLSGGNARSQALAAISDVRFHELTPADLTRYLASREWEGKAGAYAIQGLAGKFVEELRGDYSNVVGLPTELIRNCLERHFSDCRFL